LVPPPVQGLLAHAEALADLGEAQALGQVGLGLAQLGDDLFRRVSLHDSSPGPAGPQRLSYHLDQFLGSRPTTPAKAGHAFRRPISSAPLPPPTSTTLPSAEKSTAAATAAAVQGANVTIAWSNSAVSSVLPAIKA